MVGLPILQTHAWPPMPDPLQKCSSPAAEPRAVSCFTLRKHLLPVCLDCQFTQGRNHHPQNIGGKNCGYFYFPWAFCKVSHVNCWLIWLTKFEPYLDTRRTLLIGTDPIRWPFSFIFWQPSIWATNPQRPAHTPCLPKPSSKFTFFQSISHCFRWICSLIFTHSSLSLIPWLSQSLALSRGLLVK